MKENKYFRQNRHSCYNLQYHLVLVTKYRKPAINDAVLDTIRGVIDNTFSKNKCEIIALNHDTDHIHLMFVAPPQVCLSNMINSIKTVSSRLIRRDHTAWVNRFYRDSVFWSRSYYIGSVGDTTSEIVKLYVENQRKEQGVSLSPPKSDI